MVTLADAARKPLIYRGAVTFTNATSKVNRTAHGRVNGDLVTFYLESGAVIPTGLAINRDYYVINKTANDYQIALTVGGAAVTFSTDGSGTINAYAVDQQSPMRADKKVYLSNVPLPKPCRITNLVAGSRVRVSDANDNLNVLYLANVAGTETAFSTKFGGFVIVRARLLGHKPYEQQAYIGANGLDLYVSQEIDIVA